MPRLVAVLLLIVVLFAVPGAVRARDTAVPTVAAVPAVTCSAQPIPYERLQRIAAMPVATPAPASDALASPVPGLLPPGTPADDATAKEVDRRILLVTACANAGDLLRRLGLYSDRFLSTALAGQAIPKEAYLAELGKTDPRPAGAQVLLYGFSAVIFAPDGRAVVSVLSDDQSTPRPPSYTLFYFVREDGEWRIDASYDTGDQPTS